MYFFFIYSTDKYRLQEKKKKKLHSWDNFHLNENSNLVCFFLPETIIYLIIKKNSFKLIHLLIKIIYLTNNLWTTKIWIYSRPWYELGKCLLYTYLFL